VSWQHPVQFFERISEAHGLSQYRLARTIGVPAQRMGEIVAGTRAGTAGMHSGEDLIPSCTGDHQT
jgi:plasmid maintenance system antidote protein VapI